MKKIMNFIRIASIMLAIMGILTMLVGISYKIWRAEHPQAKTWTFFVGH